MGEIIPLKLQPLVRVDRFGGLWGVSVRPCPDGIQSLKSFDSESAAADYATALKVAHGWRIRPERFDLSQIDTPGAA